MIPAYLADKLSQPTHRMPPRTLRTWRRQAALDALQLGQIDFDDLVEVALHDRDVAQIGLRLALRSLPGLPARRAGHVTKVVTLMGIKQPRLKHLVADPRVTAAVDDHLHRVPFDQAAHNRDVYRPRR